MSLAHTCRIFNEKIELFSKSIIRCATIISPQGKKVGHGFFYINQHLKSIKNSASCFCATVYLIAKNSTNFLWRKYLNPRVEFPSRTCTTETFVPGLSLKQQKSIHLVFEIDTGHTRTNLNCYKISATMLQLWPTIRPKLRKRSGENVSVVWEWYASTCTYDMLHVNSSLLHVHMTCYMSILIFVISLKFVLT